MSISRNRTKEFEMGKYDWQYNVCDFGFVRVSKNGEFVVVGVVDISDDMLYRMSQGENIEGIEKVSL